MSIAKFQKLTFFGLSRLSYFTQFIHRCQQLNSPNCQGGCVFCIFRTLISSGYPRIYRVSQVISLRKVIYNKEIRRRVYGWERVSGTGRTRMVSATSTVGQEIFLFRNIYFLQIQGHSLVHLLFYTDGQRPDNNGFCRLI